MQALLLSALLLPCARIRILKKQEDVERLADADAGYSLVMVTDELSSDYDGPIIFFEYAHDDWFKNKSAPSVFFASVKITMGGSVVKAIAPGKEPRLPAYGLLGLGWPPILRTGLMSGGELTDFLSFQLDSGMFDFGPLSPEAQEAASGGPLALASHAHERPNGMIAIAFVTSEEEKRTVERAARNARAMLEVRFYLRNMSVASVDVARDLGIPSPSVVVVRGADVTMGRPTLDKTGWPIFEPRSTAVRSFAATLGGKNWDGLATFLASRTHPFVIPVKTDTLMKYEGMLKPSPEGLTVLLFYNPDGKFAAKRPENEDQIEAYQTAMKSASARAHAAVAEVAEEFEGVARFVSMDWFDNQPGFAMSLSPAGTDDGDLPFVVAVRGTLGESLTKADENNVVPDSYRPRVLRKPKLADGGAAGLRKFVVKALKAAGERMKPPVEYRTWRPSGEAADDDSDDDSDEKDEM